MEQTLRDKLANAYLALIPLITINFLWFVTCLPLVTAIPATGALFYATNRLVHGHGADWRTFFEGFRICFRRSWAWGLLNVVVVVLLVSNFLYYTRVQQNNVPWVPALVLVLAFLWLMLQVYTFPLMLEQEKPSLRTAMRNSLIVMIKRPFPALGVTLLIVILAVASVVLIAPAWLFITASACAYLANGATLSAIQKITGKQALDSSPEA